MMFLEFFVWGGWSFAITGYAHKILHFSGPQIGLIVSTTAFGAIIAPLFVGYVADRLFATERMLAIMHLAAGGCLILAAQQTDFTSIMILLMLNGLFFMPTLALANSLAFRHIPDPARFPRVAVLGTLGWIASNLLVAVALGGTDKNWFFYVSGGGGILMALYCLTLPHTPPKGAGQAGGDVFGLGALKLLREPSFLVFTLCMFLVTIPTMPVFWTAVMPMLQERGYPAPLALMTLNQFSEILFMFSMPLFVTGLGLKWVLAIGMLAWTARFLCFAVGGFPLVILGLLLHGLCYSFVYVGAYMYVDRRAPADVKASAQSLIAFLMLGVGWLLGSTLGGHLMKWIPAQIAGMPAVAVSRTVKPGGIIEQQWTKLPEAPLPRWDDPQAAHSAWRYLDLSASINRLVTGKLAPPAPDLPALLGIDPDGETTLAELETILTPIATMPAVAVSRTVKPGGVVEQQWTKLREAPLPRWDDLVAARIAPRDQNTSAANDRVATAKAATPVPGLATLLGVSPDGTITLADLEKITGRGLEIDGRRYFRNDLIDVFRMIAASGRPTGGARTEIRVDRAKWLAAQRRGLEIDGRIYSRSDLIAVFKKIAALNKPAGEAPGEIRVDRAQWLAAQSRDWPLLWFWPACAAFAIFLFFILAFRDKRSPDPGPKEEAA
jgi:nucleoside transporter